MKANKIFSLDLETDGLHWGCNILDVFVHTGTGKKIHIKWDKKRNDNPEMVDVLLALADPDSICIMHNAKYDLRVLQDHGVQPKCKIYCSMLLAQMLFPNDEEEMHKRQPHDLKNLARKFLNEPFVEEDRATKWLKKNGFKKGMVWELPDMFRIPYGHKDAQTTFELFYLFMQTLKERKMVDLYKFEMELMLGPIMQAERRGLHIDRVLCRKLCSVALRDRQETLTKCISLSGNSEFNPASPKQVSEAVYDGSVPVEYWTKGNAKSGPQPSTDGLALTLADTPLARAVLEFRQAKRAYDYLSSYLKLSDPSGKLHYGLAQGGTKTGRFSSQNPNLQNLPRPGTSEDKGPLRRVRSVFTAMEDRVLVFVDYHQIELRLAAHFSGQSWMVEAFNEGRNLHKEACLRYFGKKEGDKDYKEIYYPVTKNLNFAMLYGAQAKKLKLMFLKQAGINVSLSDAVDYRNKYIAQNDRIMLLFETIGQEVLRTGGITNPFGRFVPVDTRMTYKGVNYKVQGTAAEIIKRKMRKCYDILKSTKSYICLQVHDELVFHMHKDDLHLISKLLDTMTVNGVFSVPLTVSLAIGKSWGKKKEFEINDFLTRYSF